MKGKQYNDDIREKALALLIVNNNVAYVAEKLGLPYTTVRQWKLNAEKKSGAKFDITKTVKEDKSDNEKKNVKKECKLESNFVELRTKKKMEFIDKAWELIDDSIAVANKRIKRARTLEDNIDIVASAIIKNAGKITEATGIGWFSLLDLVKELNSMKSPKIGELSTMIGVMYDKQALSQGEATAIQDIKIVVDIEE